MMAFYPQSGHETYEFWSDATCESVVGSGSDAVQAPVSKARYLVADGNLRLHSHKRCARKSFGDILFIPCSTPSMGCATEDEVLKTNQELAKKGTDIVLVNVDAKQRQLTIDVDNSTNQIWMKQPG